jgi:Cd2+/Zn2+-exporting ATPase
MKVHQQSSDQHIHQHTHQHTHQPFNIDQYELKFSLLCGIFTLIGWVIEGFGGSSSMIVSFSSSSLSIYLVSYLLAYLFGSFFMIKELITFIKEKKFDINLLMLLAAIGAGILGEWFEGALLLFLFALGHALEHFALKKARNAISSLSNLVPQTAIRLHSNASLESLESLETQEQEVPVEELQINDRILVKPHTRLPIDGIIMKGSSDIDQSPITGESIAVEKRQVDDLDFALKNPNAISLDHKVFAGTINGASALEVIVTRKSSDSTIARVVQMVEHAESQKSTTQHFTDRFEKIFVPIVLLLVSLLCFAWVFIDESFAQSFYRAMAVLVASSPCALALSTPSAVLSGIARAAKSGVLIKGGAHLEILADIKAFAFDKTGTLTQGKPKLTQIIQQSDLSEEDFLTIAVSIEKQSDHPLAQAIVSGAYEKYPTLKPNLATEVENLVGYGVRGNVNGKSITIAKPGYFEKNKQSFSQTLQNTIQSFKDQGQSIVIVKADDLELGAFALMDLPRKNAKQVIQTLKSIGITKTMMLTGDHQAVASAVAKQIDLNEVYGDLLPEDKVRVMKTLSQSEKIAMVGDGVNDAPAMANATVAIAIGASGSDVALETADIALMSDDLSTIPFAIELSKATKKIIIENLWISLGMVALLMPLTAFGFAKMGLAVALHEGSTLLVVLNALRLLRFKDPFKI